MANYIGSSVTKKVGLSVRVGRQWEGSKQLRKGKSSSRSERSFNGAKSFKTRPQ